MRYRMTGLSVSLFLISVYNVHVKRLACIGIEVHPLSVFAELYFCGGLFRVIPATL